MWLLCRISTRLSWVADVRATSVESWQRLVRSVRAQQLPKRQVRLHPGLHPQTKRPSHAPSQACFLSPVPDFSLSLSARRWWWSWTKRVYTVSFFVPKLARDSTALSNRKQATCPHCATRIVGLWRSSGGGFIDPLSACACVCLPLASVNSNLKGKIS